ncbi:unnamed protein product [Sphenostylis stenocarpa]|uniref:Uncharacterized protein n=1 Tax=Sphenostylis stenocarpa TaxID=92480 RepID=A0AA86SW56_9FABA|nr:unnamed protein product [Sphenostylis stenocarpa]
MKLPKASLDNARMLAIGAGKMEKLDIEIISKPLSEMLTCAGEADVVFTSSLSFLVQGAPASIGQLEVSLPPLDTLHIGATLLETGI